MRYRPRKKLDWDCEARHADVNGSPRKNLATIRFKALAKTTKHVSAAGNDDDNGIGKIALQLPGSARPGNRIVLSSKTQSLP